MSLSQSLAMLVACADRAAAARALARELGAEDLIVLVRDPDVGALLPPPGFPPTLRGGASWRDFVRRCSVPGRHAGRVELPRGSERRAEALAGEGLALILLGDQASQEALSGLAEHVPLLAFAFAAEQRARAATAAAQEERRAAVRAHALAQALDAARADAARLNAELRAQQRLKDRFLAMLAHELRNPLSPIVHSLDLLRMSEPADSVVGRRVEVMTRHARQLSRLTNDLLDIARVSRGRIELVRERLSLDEIVRDAAEATQPIFEARRHSLELALGDEPLWVDGDRTRLTQVLANLLHNAAKYTPPGGRVRLAGARDGVRARLTVTDSGIGIDAESLPNIFDLFQQGEQPLARGDAGLGIGLTLVRALVELHGGQVFAESDGPGRGSRFTLVLPLAQETARAMDAREPADGGAVQSSRGLRVLVVDDNEDAANVLGALVQAVGHHAQVAHSATSALQLSADSEFDLAFLDIGLPDLDGYELARRLRRLRPRAYLVALTGYGGAEDTRRAREAGFDEHLVKPASLERVLAAAQRTAAGLSGSAVSDGAGGALA